jgi:hypothetical protein
VHTETPPPTPTLATAVVGYLYGPNLRAEPDSQSELLAFLPQDTAVILLDGREIADGLTWRQGLESAQAGF